MNSTNNWCVLHQHDWLGSYGPSKFHTVLAMLMMSILVMIMTWNLPSWLQALCVYQTCIMVTIFAHFFSYRKIWKTVQVTLPTLTTEESQSFWVYTTKCYSVRAFWFSVFWPAFFLPRSSKKQEYER